MKLIASNINHFYNKSTKAKNGEINSIRELIIITVYNDTNNLSKEEVKALVDKKLYTSLGNSVISEFLKDTEYGDKWYTIIKETYKIIGIIHDMIPQDKIKDYTSRILERGDNSILDSKSKNTKSILSNVDFGLVYYKDNNKIHIEPIEFKFSASKITDVPQLIQDNDNKVYCPDDIPTFTKYIYNKLFTDEYLSILGLEKPSFDEYVEILSISCPKKEWHKTNIYPEFFKKLRAKVSNKKDFMDREEQIRKNYIKFYGNKRFTLDYIKAIFDKQLKKNFILFKNNQFVLHQLKGNEGAIKICANDKCPLALKFTDSINCYEYRLCWKNRNGILNPAWKFAIKKL